jgi:hypothetical protein
VHNAAMATAADPTSLYALPLEEFIGARDELARQLKESGDDAASKAVRALRKPSVAAWAVNQLARSARDDLSALMQAGERVGAAQQKAFSGSGRDELQRATADRSRLLDRLVSMAGEVLEGAGHGATRATLDLVADTLRATATDEETATLVREGRLAKEVRAPSGFEEFLGLAPAQAREARPSSSRASPADEKARRRTEELSRAADDAEQEAARLREKASSAESELRRAQQAALRADAAAERAEQRAARARAKADEAVRKAEGRG